MCHSHNANIIIFCTYNTCTARTMEILGIFDITVGGIRGNVI